MRCRQMVLAVGERLFEQLFAGPQSYELDGNVILSQPGKANQIAREFNDLDRFAHVQNQNLPGFVVLTSGGNDPDAGKSIWGSGFLPSVYQGVQCRSSGDPVLFIKDPEGMTRDLRKASIDAINEVNRLQHQEYQDPETLSRIAQYEMAYKMQITAPEVMNINNEPQYIRDMYGVYEGKNSFANNVLLARKLVENGVRFVQLFDWGWDMHGTGKENDLPNGLPKKCRDVDRAAAALVLHGPGDHSMCRVPASVA